MSFDEQPYDKNDHDLHDAVEEIKSLRAALAEKSKELESVKSSARAEAASAQIHYEARTRLERERDAWELGFKMRYEGEASAWMKRAEKAEKEVAALESRISELDAARSQANSENAELKRQAFKVGENRG